MQLLESIPIPSGGNFVSFDDDVLEQSIAQRFEKQARRHGDRLAIKWGDGEYDYASLNATANRLARTIVARRGPVPEPIALLFDHGGDALAAILAVLKAGKFYVVLDPSYPAERLEYMLEDSGAKLVVADRTHCDEARRLGGSALDVIRFDDVDPTLSADDLPAQVTPGSLAMILYTSGSTGRPKGVLHSHRSVLADARNITNGLRVCAGDRWLLYTSLSFANSVRTIYASLLNGASVFPYDLKRGSFGELRTWIVDNRITIVRGVPTFFRGFMKTVSEAQTFPDVRVLSLGGEPMLRADLRYFNRHFSPHCVLVHAFGPTECLTVCWALIPHGTPIGDGKLPIGHPLPDKEVLLLDETGREVADGNSGQIAVKSRCISPGYWRDPDRTLAAFLPDPAGGRARIYLTGDIGRRNEEGWLIHVGRQDFQVKVRGFRIDVAEIENALRAVSGVGDAVVVGREVSPGEQRLFAYFVASKAPAPAAGVLREALARKLPDYMIPSAFVALDAFPQTPNGKMDRLGLPMPIPGDGDARGARAVPRSEIEAELASMWADVLGIDNVGIDDAFLDLGGDSLRAAMIAARVTARYEFDLPAHTLLAAGTVAKMAAAVVASIENSGRLRRPGATGVDIAVG